MKPAEEAPTVLAALGPKMLELSATRTAAAVFLTNGDMLRGTVTALDATTLTLETWYAGTMKIKRAMVRLIEPAVNVAGVLIDVLMLTLTFVGGRWIGMRWQVGVVAPEIQRLIIDGLMRSSCPSATCSMPRSASLTAGAITSAHFIVPKRSSALATPATWPGTAIEW